jgi:hypothetical protein
MNNNFKLQEITRYSQLELLKQMTEYSIPVDKWFDDIPEDLYSWNKSWEHTRIETGEVYRCYIKTIDRHNVFIIYGYINHFKPENLC